MKKPVLTSLAGLVGLYLILMIPLPDPVPEEVHQTPAGTPFFWSQDSVWHHLEESFVKARAAGCPGIRDAIENGLVDLDRELNTLDAGERSTGEDPYAAVEEAVFSLAPLIAGCPDYAEEYMRRISRLRIIMKEMSWGWDMNDPRIRSRLYRLLYGGRAVLEEVMLQIPAGTLPSTTVLSDESAATPSTEILGVTIHSGDILLSRGGAPTSALIARGNDYPGNFSHVALVYVDPDTRVPTILEAHIERGVTMSTLEEYLQDKKLRVMVLRLRQDLVPVASDSSLPHTAATLAFEDARRRHIPYDFSMDYEDPTELFCSEVASAAYRQAGVELWMGRSTISSPGLRTWLAAFGVRHFVTQEPSDLEYDPQLRVVAEWRDAETLYKDHLDNAVTEAMLEGAEKGDVLKADVWKLPIARTMKAYSVLLNLFGGVGPVPEGMSASAALKNAYYSGRHDDLTAKLRDSAARFEAERGYRPPYWRLVDLARELNETHSPH